MNQNNKFLFGSFVLFMASAGYGTLGFGELKLINITGIITLLLLFFNKPVLKYKWLYAVLMLSVFYAGLLDSLSGNDSSGMMISKAITVTLSFLLVDYVAKLPTERLEKLFRITNYSFMIANAIVMFIVFFVPSIKEGFIDISQHGLRFRGFFEQTNGYALMLVFYIPVALYAVTKRPSIINISSLLVALSCVILSQSRGLIFGMVLAVALMYTFKLIINPTFRRIISYTRIFILFGIVLTGVVVFMPEILSDKFGISMERLNSGSETSILKTDKAIDERNYLFEAGLKTLEANPQGIGFVDNHIIIGKLTGVYLLPHNYFITLFLNYGIGFGLVWFMLFVITIYRGCRVIIAMRFGGTDLFFFLVLLMVLLCIYLLTHSSDFTYIWIYMAIVNGLYEKKMVELKGV